jgi:hypothetical protein
MVLLLSSAMALAWWFWPSAPPKARLTQQAEPTAPEVTPARAATTALHVSRTHTENVTASTPSASSPRTPFADTPPPEREFFEELNALHATDKPAALFWAEQGERWYGDGGRFADARRAMRITLLADLQRMAEARSLARAFIAQYPQSPYRPLVQGVTGIHPRPSGPRPSSP